MIEVDQLTKRFGPTTAVDDLSFAFRPCRLALATKQFPSHEGRRTSRGGVRLAPASPSGWRVIKAAADRSRPPGRQRRSEPPPAPVEPGARFTRKHNSRAAIRGWHLHRHCRAAVGLATSLVAPLAWSVAFPLGMLVPQAKQDWRGVWLAG